jgi:PPK2 family polyphosphate:nucleotide phosphotransferase
MPSIDPKDYRVRPGHAVQLHKWPTRIDPTYSSKAEYHDLLQRHTEELTSLQSILYASNQRALLLILQGMDAAGKDGVIKHVMSGVNPSGCQVFSFKHPGPEELQHDFLWSGIRRLPERGHIGIFNRSYYEEVLIVRVHPEILQGEDLPRELTRKKDFWEHRYRSILDLERHLHRNGTSVVKFFLHLSKEEQRKRFLHRIDDPDKNWKLSMDDIAERKYWKDYQRVYEDCLGATSTDHSPWYIIPADDKPATQLLVSKIILDTLRKLNLSYPKSDARHRRELEAIRKKLEK